MRKKLIKGKVEISFTRKLWNCRSLHAYQQYKMYKCALYMKKKAEKNKSQKCSLITIMQWNMLTLTGALWHTLQQENEKYQKIFHATCQILQCSINLRYSG
jgi:hypothetical protein